jgi:hypothetical protein
MVVIVSLDNTMTTYPLDNLQLFYCCCCLDETRQELQSVLTSLDPAIGSSIARLHSRICEQEKLQLKQQLPQEPEATTMV